MTAHDGFERMLLLLAGLALLIGTTAVSLAGKAFSYQGPAVALALGVAWLTAHAVLRARRHRGDPLLLPLAALLVALGLTMILRLKPVLFVYQAAWAGVGLIAFLAAAFFFRQLDKLADYKYVCGLFGVALLLTAILFGVDINGNKNWVVVGPLRFQPSEFAKLFIVVYLAAYLNEHRQILTMVNERLGPLSLPPLRFIAPLFAVWGLAMLMFVLQRDLGSALLFFGIVLVMMYLASGRLTYVLFGMVLFLLGAVACYGLYQHVQVRVDVWLNPWLDANGKGYQILQSLFALGTGGILGTGLTFGSPALIPEVHTDFIFSAIGEELGLAGTAAVMMTYLLIIGRAFRTALRAGNSFLSLVAAGLAAATALQIFIIVGGVTKFLPLTGITLPFISYGGSSMVANFIVLGALSAISEQRSDQYEG